jgi:hypothetical protein
MSKQETTKDLLCPRCQENLIPSNEHAGKYPGALSRADNETEICSSCGYDEAMKDLLHDGCEPKEAWPIWLRFETEGIKF